MRIATWNVNSIRSRIDRVEAFLTRHEIDVLALQETKARDDQWPLMGLEAMGHAGGHPRAQPVERRGDREPGRARRRTARGSRDAAVGGAAGLEARLLGATCGSAGLVAVRANGRAR